MYLMQTVSTVPRARPLTVRRSRSMDRNGPECAEPPDNRIRHARVEDLPLPPGQQYPPISRRRNPREHSAVQDSSEKKKEKKWSLGGLFRRRKKDADSDSSSQEDEDTPPRKGFLARRRSRREKRKQRAKIVGTFDHVVVNPLSHSQIKQNRPPDVNGHPGILHRGSDAQNDNSAVVGRAVVGRGSRDSLGGSVDRLSSRSSRESLPQQHRRQDSSLSRNSSGSGSMEGSTSRRGKRGLVKARAEALRDQQRGGSSSDECDGFPVSPSLSRYRSDDNFNPVQREGSFNRRSRNARTERYIRRLSRDEETILKKEAEMDLQQRQRLCKSDAEGNLNKPCKNVAKVAGSRWPPLFYQESCDVEARHVTKTSSTTPSPAQSPSVRPKPILQYTSSAPPCDSLTSTFPPSHNYYHGPAGSKSPPQNSNIRVPLGSRPSSTRGQSPAPCNRSNDSLPTYGLPRSRTDYLPSRQNVTYENVYTKGMPNHGYELPHTGQRSHSYDNNIHHATAFVNNVSGPSAIKGADDVMVIQFPITRPQALQARPMELPIGRGNSASPSLFKQGPPPPPPRDPQRRLTSTSNVQDPPRPMSYAFESGSQHAARIEYSLNHLNRPVDHNGNIKTFSFVPQPHIISNIPSTGSTWGNYQRRSSSDNQIAAQYPQQAQQVRAQILNLRPRPSSVTPEAMRPLSQQLNNPSRITSRTPPDNSNQNKQQCSLQFQYFADQQPRSRKPIHIQCNNSLSSSDQPYLSDSQVVMMKPPYQDRRNHVHHATEFWRQKEQEGVVKQRKASSKPPLQYSARSDRSRSNSPRPREHVIPESFRTRPAKVRVSALGFPVRTTDSLSSLSGQSDVSSPMQPSKVYSDGSCYDSYDSSGAGTHAVDSLRKKDSSNLRPLSMVLENSESQEHTSPSPVNEEVTQTLTGTSQSNTIIKSVPPAPPVRRYSRQSSTSSLEAGEWLADDNVDEENRKRRSTNLEDALNELEAIYNSLRLGDEDLLDRAERRDLPSVHQQHRCSFPQNYHSWSSSRGAESDSGFNYGHGSSYDSVCDLEPPVRRQRAPAIRRSGVPDKVADDMAYRRLHPKDRPGSQDIRSVVSQSGSYLLASPALSQSPATDSVQLKSSSSVTDEPDVTFDDVVYRNIKHANNTLKIADPQPPFGIPLGPITTAANSDYLHATPVDRYRSTFKPRKVPDIVKDDLAFRNLRKDSQKDSSSLPQSTIDDTGTFLNSSRNENSNFSMRKKRAVRSLSANLMSLVRKDKLPTDLDNKEMEFEKAQSLSDLPDALQVAQKILEGKEVIGGGSVKLRNIACDTSDEVKHRSDSESAVEGVILDSRYGVNPISWIERANLDKSLAAGTSTSTETLTDSRANPQHDAVNRRGSWQQRLRIYIPTQNEYSQRTSAPHTPERKSSLSKAPLCSPPADVSQPITGDVPTSPIDEGQLEELLTALAREARATSERLDIELQQLGDDDLQPTTKSLENKLTTEKAKENTVEERESLLTVDSNQNNILKSNLNYIAQNTKNNSTSDDIYNVNHYTEPKRTSPQKKNETFSATSNDTEETVAVDSLALEELTSSRSRNRKLAINSGDEEVKCKQVCNETDSLVMDVKVGDQNTLPTVTDGCEETEILDSNPEYSVENGNEITVNDTIRVSDTEQSNQDVHNNECSALPSQKVVEDSTQENDKHDVSSNRFGNEIHTDDNEEMLVVIKQKITVVTKPAIVADAKVDREGEVKKAEEQEIDNVPNQQNICVSEERVQHPHTPVTVDIMTDTAEGTPPPFAYNVKASDEDNDVMSDGTQMQLVEDDISRDMTMSVTQVGDDDIEFIDALPQTELSDKRDVADTSQSSLEVRKSSVEEVHKDTENVEHVEKGDEERQDTVYVQKVGADLFQPSSCEGEASSSCSWHLDPATILVACSYCIACTHNIVGLDLFAIVGLILAIISILAVFVL